MSFPRYPKYKDSGVEWLGEVPEHWGVRPLRDLAKEGRTSFVDGDWIESPYITNEGIRLIQTGNIGVGVYREQGFRFVSAATFEELRCTEVAPGDLLICRLAEPVGRACLAPTLDSRMITSVDVCILKSRPDVDSRFAVFMLSSARYLGYMEGQCRGGTRDRVSRSFLGNVRVGVPAYAEQVQISTFLDCETDKIDQLVEEQRRLIALLRVKHQAVISHAVTKGLNPDVPMKPSGIEWLGDVPAHWGVTSVRRIVKWIEQGWSPECFARPADADEWGVVKSGCVNRGVFAAQENKALPETLDPIPEYEIRVGDVLMSRASGSPELVGSTAYVSMARPKLMLSDKIFRIQPQPSVDRQYFVATFNSRAMRSQIERAISGADGLANNLPQSALKSFFFLVPPVHEQSAIATFLARESSRIDTLTAEAHHAISLLLERRAALISAAVTGQIDVRSLEIAH